MSSPSPSHLGEVIAFDREVGLGELRTDDGAVVRFHCVAIADGSRDIAVGTRVRCTTMLRFGTVEATDVAAV